MPCVDETRSSGTKETNSFFQEPDDVGIVARPAYCFFRPLEMYNVIRRVRFPEIFCGTSNVNTSHPDRIAQDGYEQIVRIPVFSKNDECFYRWIVCVFTFIHVFFFDFESAKLCYKGTKRYENTYLFLIFFFLIGLLGEPFFFLVAPSFLYFRSVLSLCRRFLFSSSTLSDCCRKSNWLGLWLSNSLESTRLNNTEKHSANTTK